MNIAQLCLGLALAALVAACAPISPPPTSPLVTASPWVTPRPSMAPEVAIIYEREGGFAGRHDVWRIYADGRVEATAQGQATTHARLPAEAVAEAMQRIALDDFLALKSSYMPLNQCCDRFTYRLTIIQGGATKTVITMDGAEQPPVLIEALQAVQSLVQQARPAP